MKCSNPDCNRGIGLVSYRRGLFGKQRYCSRNCRDAFPADLTKQSRQDSRAMTYFEWLFSQPIELRWGIFSAPERGVKEAVADASLAPGCLMIAPVSEAGHPAKRTGGPQPFCFGV